MPTDDRPADPPTVDRRRVLTGLASGLSLGTFGSLSVLGCGDGDERPPALAQIGPPSPDDVAIRDRLSEIWRSSDVPGFSVALVRDAAPAWAHGFGWADVEKRREMTAETLLNIGSVTKTVTATAALQQVERQALELDANVEAHLAFPLRNPRHPDRPITLRQLLTHRSSIRDAKPYEESYACGDPSELLSVWLERYFTQADLSDRFHEWAPGTEDPPEEPRPYSNVAYGLIGLLIESVTGLRFERACRQRIFSPLGMASSRFRLEEIDRSLHATPYTPLGDDFDPSAADARALLPARDLTVEPPRAGELLPHCLYSFATPPDGLLRTSAADLARFLSCWAGDGSLGEARILRTESVRSALTPNHFGRALCWVPWTRPEGEPFWSHSGGDPGVVSFAAFRPKQRSGFAVLCNTDSPGTTLRAVVDALLPSMV